MKFETLPKREQLDLAIWSSMPAPVRHELRCYLSGAALRVWGSASLKEQTRIKAIGLVAKTWRVK